MCSAERGARPRASSLRFACCLRTMLASRKLNGPSRRRTTPAAWTIFLLFVSGVAAQGRSGSWRLAMNVNPNDGHNFGWMSELWYTQNKKMGTGDHALMADFLDSDVFQSKGVAQYITIARHRAGRCEAAKVWRFSRKNRSMRNYFQTASRSQVTRGGEIFSYVEPGLKGKAVDPIFGGRHGKRDLVFNWYASVLP